MRLGILKYGVAGWRRGGGEKHAPRLPLHSPSMRDLRDEPRATSTKTASFSSDNSRHLRALIVRAMTGISRPGGEQDLGAQKTTIFPSVGYDYSDCLRQKKSSTRRLDTKRRCARHFETAIENNGKARQVDAKASCEKKATVCRSIGASKATGTKQKRMAQTS